MILIIHNCSVMADQTCKFTPCCHPHAYPDSPSHSPTPLTCRYYVLLPYLPTHPLTNMKPSSPQNTTTTAAPPYLPTLAAAPTGAHHPPPAPPPPLPPNPLRPSIPYYASLTCSRCTHFSAALHALQLSVCWLSLSMTTSRALAGPRGWRVPGAAPAQGTSPPAQSWYHVRNLMMPAL